MKCLKSKLMIALIFLSAAITISQASKIFFMNQGYTKLQSANIDGSNITDIVSDISLGEGIAIDTVSIPMKIYYSERGESRIVRVNFDGSDPEEIITDISGIIDIDLDPKNRKIYWVKHSGNDARVQRADMDSLNSNIEDLYTSTFGDRLQGVAIDTANQWIFWTQTRSGLVDIIRRMNFDGSDVTIVDDFRNPKDIDVVDDKIYWSWYEERSIMRSNKDASDIDTLITEVASLFIDVDTSLAKIYYSDGGAIGCANLDGSDNGYVITELGDVRGVAIYYDPSAVSIEPEKGTLNKYELKQNYPNPFNPSTKIEFTLKKPDYVLIEIFNTLGKKVTTLLDTPMSAGQHSVTFNGQNFPSGIYFYQIKAGNIRQVKKMVLIK